MEGGMYPTWAITVVRWWVVRGEREGRQEWGGEVVRLGLGLELQLGVWCTHTIPGTNNSIR